MPALSYRERLEEVFSLADGAHRGLLVSIPVPSPIAQRLALPGGEPPASMHVTLCYVGAAKDLPPDEIADLRDAVEAVVSRTKPFTFDVVGTGRFPATEFSDNLDVLYAVVVSSDLMALRSKVYDALTRAGVEPNHNFEYSPHITMQYIAPEQTVTPVLPEVLNVPVTTIDVSKDDLLKSFPLGRQFEIEAAAIEALKKLPTSSTGAGSATVVRSTAVFKKPMSTMRVPLNRKTTENSVTSVLIDELEPLQEFVPVSGLTKYITKPRRDPADIARIETPNGVRYVVQEGHTRLAAARLRGETTIEVRQWEFVQNAAGGYDAVPRGMHKRGIASLSYREKLTLLADEVVYTLPFAEYEDFDDCVAKNSDKDDPKAYCATIKRAVEGRADLGDRSKYPGGKFPSEETTGAKKFKEREKTERDNAAERLAQIKESKKKLSDDEGCVDEPVVSLPDIADVSFPTMVGAMKERPLAKRKKTKKAKYLGVTLGRRPTAFEAFVLSLSSIPRRYDAELERVVEELADLRREHLTATLATSVDSRSKLDLAQWSRTAAVLTAAQDRMARYGVVELRNECRRQGLQLADLPEQDRAFNGVVKMVPVLADSVKLMADALHSDWTASLRRIALKVQRTKRSSDRIVELAEGKVLQGLKNTSRHLLHESFGVPRQAYMEAIAAASTAGFKSLQVLDRSGKPIGQRIDMKRVDDDDAERLVDYVIQSAVMDLSTCDPCADADGLTFEYGDDDMDEYAPPYIRCLGGDNCRCVQIYVLKTGGSWIVREDKIL